LNTKINQTKEISLGSRAQEEILIIEYY